jgi:hypothetical protein
MARSPAVSLSETEPPVSRAQRGVAPRRVLVPSQCANGSEDEGTERRLSVLSMYPLRCGGTLTHLCAGVDPGTPLSASVISSLASATGKPIAPFTATLLRGDLVLEQTDTGSSAPDDLVCPHTKSTNPGPQVKFEGMRAGADKGVLRYGTHGSAEDTVDVYKSFGWATLCEQDAKLRIDRGAAQVAG